MTTAKEFTLSSRYFHIYFHYMSSLAVSEVRVNMLEHITYSTVGALHRLDVTGELFDVVGIGDS